MSLIIGFLFCVFTTTSVVYAQENVGEDAQVTYVYESTDGVVLVKLVDDTNMIMEIKIEGSDSLATVNGTYEIDGDKLVLTYLGGTSYLIIQEDGTLVDDYLADDGPSDIGEPDDLENKVATFMDWLSKLSLSDFHNIVVAICAFFGINISAIVAGIIIYIRNKSKEIANNKVYKAIIEEMEANRRAEFAAAMEAVMSHVDRVDANLQLAFNKQSAEKQKESLEKAKSVADELDAIAESLK